MKELELSLTNQSHVPRLELGGNFMSDVTPIEERFRVGQAPAKKEAKREPENQDKGDSTKEEDKKDKQESKKETKSKKDKAKNRDNPQRSSEKFTPDVLRQAKAVLESPENQTRWDDLNVDVKRAIIELIKEGKYPKRGPGAMGGGPVLPGGPTGPLPGGAGPGGPGGPRGVGPGGGPRPAHVDIRVEDMLRSEAMVAEFRAILSSPLIVNALRNPTPDLDAPPLSRLKVFMDRLDISKPEFDVIARDIADLTTRKNLRNPNTGSIENVVYHVGRNDNWVSEESRRLLFERVYEKIIGRPDQGFEEAQYSVGSYDTQIKLVALDTLSIGEFKNHRWDTETPFYVYLSKLQHMRMVMHELNRNLHYGDQYKEFVTKELRSSGLSFVHNGISGVESVVRLYEKLASQKVSKSKYWLSHGDMEEIDKEVVQIFEKLGIRRGGRRLSDWEEKRALRLGGILFKGTQRMGLYASMGEIPPMLATPDRIGSLPYEYMGRALVPYKMIAARFFASDKGGPKEFLKWALKFQEEQETNYMDMFGFDKRVMMLNSYGAVDAESHGWRIQLMFFGAIRLRMPNGTTQTLLDYVQRAGEDFDSTPGDPLLGGGEISSKEKMIDPIDGREKSHKEAYSNRIKKYILGQRLYLSALQKYGNLSDDVKIDIWRKIAILKPSTIAAMDPGAVNGEASWSTLREKLFIAEEKRVLTDGERYNDKNRPLDDAYLNSEITNFVNARRIASLGRAWTNAEFDTLLQYMGMSGDLNNLTAAEKTLLEKIIKRGIGRAGDFTKAKMPFNFTIDDTADIAWSKTGEGDAGLAEEDILRILISDQKSFGDAWNEMNSFTESPTEKAVEHIAKAVDGIGNVIGRDSAQKIVEPFILAYMKMAETYEHVKWIPGGKSYYRMRRKPTSIMEEYYRQSFESLDAEDKALFLEGLAQAKAVSDNTKDLKEKQGIMMTQLDYLKKKTKSTRLRVMFEFAKTIIYILGPIAGYELLKVLIPTPKH